jgi:hypothetical protein
MTEIEETELKIIGQKEAIKKFKDELASCTSEEDTRGKRGAKHLRFALLCSQYRLEVEEAKLQYLSTLKTLEANFARLGVL